MTRQFHARIRRGSRPKLRELGPYGLSFKCFRFVKLHEPGAEPYEIVELCEPRNAMSALVFER